MEGDLITVQVLINRVLFKPTLININCKYYSIVNKNLITELRLPRVKIPPKPITGFIKENCHGASCMQANDAEGRKDDRLRKERKRENLAKVGRYLHGKKGGINSG